MRRASRLKKAERELDDTDPNLTDVGVKQRVNRRGNDPWLGRLVDNRYRVEEVLGRGGMGVVYKVKHQRMGKIAAMKVLHSELARDSDVVGRFQTEAEAVSRLGHPNTVQVFDFGTEKGSLYLVMEFVRGQDLGAIIDRDGPMDFKTLAPLLGQICGSLEEAHALGVIHRDLKPENILVSRTHSGKDFIKVLDFGLAKLSERDDSSAITSAGTIIGTPYYMCPEQIRADDVDHRADIYSFGALMYRLLTGDNAFNAKTPVGVLTKHLTEELIPPSESYPVLGIPPEVDSIILRCMAKDKNDRYESVRELLQDVEKLYLELGSGSSSSDVRQPPTEWLANSMGSTAPVAALLEDELDHGIDDQMRMRRGDLDHFETKLKRTRRFRIIVIPMLLLALAAAASYFFLLRPETPHRVEVNPNNELADATLIAPNTEVKGYIGARVNKTKADQDFFRFEASASGSGEEVTTIEVLSPPNIDIAIDLYDTRGALLKRSNESGVGESESLRRWRTKGPVVVAVSGVHLAGQIPTENVSDPYTLKVVFLPVDSRLESEPNDSWTDANSLSLASPLSGHLDHAGDIDTFRLVDFQGSYRLLISGSEDLPIQWRLGDEGEWNSSLSTQLTLDGSKVITLRRVPSDSVVRDIPYTIDISPQ